MTTWKAGITLADVEDAALLPAGAAAALGLVQSSRADLADRLVTPRWYHPVLGLLAGGLVLGYASDRLLVRYGALAGFLLGTLLLVQAYRRLTGVWVSGYHPGPARRWAVALGVTLGALLLVSLGLRALTGTLAWSVVPAVVVVPLTVVLGGRYDRALCAGLRAERP